MSASHQNVTINAYQSFLKSEAISLEFVGSKLVQMAKAEKLNNDC